MSSDKPAVGSNAVTGEPAVGKLIDALGQLALTEQRLRDLVDAMGNEETFYASTIEALQAAREHLDGEVTLTDTPAAEYKYGDKVIIGPNNVEAAEGPATILAPAAESKWYFISNLSEHPIPPKETPQGVIGGQIVHSRFIQPADDTQEASEGR